jgi:glycosyltransferase involved in cell wall biosynthesis
VLNGATVIGDLLASLVNQVAPPRDTEVIIVDNGSSDGTQDIVRRFNVTLLEEPRRGPAAGRNRGLDHARGDVIAYLDADTLPTRRWLAELLRPFASSDVVLVGGSTLSYCPMTPAERFISQMGAYKLEYSVSRGVFPFIASRNMAVRRKAALAINGWSEDMPTAEDMDFCHRLLRRFPTEIVHQPTALLFHRDRSSDSALCHQAWTYGQGLAHMYLRYPDVTRWDVPKSIRLAKTLSIRSLASVVLRLGWRLGLTPQGRAEFAAYHWLWSRWYWRGFFSMYRHKERREP